MYSVLTERIMAINPVPSDINSIEKNNSMVDIVILPKMWNVQYPARPLSCSCKVMLLREEDTNL